MKAICVLYLIWIICFTLLGELKVSGEVDNKITHKFFASTIIGVIPLGICFLLNLLL